MADGRDRKAVLLSRQPARLEAVEAVLAANGVGVVSKTMDPDQAVALLEEHRPDLFVTEDGGTDGLECIRRIRRILPGLKSLVLSDERDAASIHRALAAGATACVAKTAQREDLAAAVRLLFSRSVYFAPVPAAVAEAPADDRTARVTRREAEILRLVAEGFSNAHVARTLCVTEQTVKFHLSNIYRKLEISNRTEAARWAQIHGLLPPSPQATANGA